jgi:hypothetical protein
MHVTRGSDRGRRPLFRWGIPEVRRFERCEKSVICTSILDPSLQPHQCILAALSVYEWHMNVENTEQRIS